jgi:phage protein D
MGKRAVFNVTVAGTNITTVLLPVLIGLRVSDKVGTHTDSADIEIDDTDARIILPHIGAEVVIALGWENEGLRVVFQGTVDEVKSSGSRGSGRRLMIVAKGMDTTGPAKEGQQRHWDNQTIETILRDAAAFAGIPIVEVDPDLAGLPRVYFDARDESFIAIGERIAREVGGNFRIAGNRAILSKRNGEYQAFVLARWGDNLQSWDIAPQLGRPRFSATRARWYDMITADWQKLDRAVDLPVSALHAFRFAKPWAIETDQQTGSDKATSERDAGEGTVTIEGNTRAIPDGLCLIAGTRPGVDGTYRIETVTHSYTRARGFTTTLELKQPQQGADTDARRETVAPVAPDGTPPNADPDLTGPF